MQWVYYIGGRGRKGQLVTFRIGVSADPITQLESLATVQPYKLELLAVEEGDLDLLEQRRKQFRLAALQNDWYKASEELTSFVESLPKVNIAQGNDKKICVFFNPKEYKEIEDAVDVIGTRTKSRLIRRAIRFYLVLGRFKAKGFMLQVIRGGRFHEFSSLEDIKDPDELDL